MKIIRRSEIVVTLCTSNYTAGPGGGARTFPGALHDPWRLPGWGPKGVVALGHPHYITTVRRSVHGLSLDHALVPRSGPRMTTMNWPLIHTGETGTIKHELILILLLLLHYKANLCMLCMYGVVLFTRRTNSAQTTQRSCQTLIENQGIAYRHISEIHGCDVFLPIRTSLKVLSFEIMQTLVIPWRLAVICLCPMHCQAAADLVDKGRTEAGMIVWISLAVWHAFRGLADCHLENS